MEKERFAKNGLVLIHSNAGLDYMTRDEMLAHPEYQNVPVIFKNLETFNFEYYLTVEKETVDRMVALIKNSLRRAPFRKGKTIGYPLTPMHKGKILSLRDHPAFDSTVYARCKDIPLMYRLEEISKYIHNFSDPTYLDELYSTGRRPFDEQCGHVEHPVRVCLRFHASMRSMFVKEIKKVQALLIKDLHAGTISQNKYQCGIDELNLIITEIMSDFLLAKLEKESDYHDQFVGLYFMYEKLYNSLNRTI